MKNTQNKKFENQLNHLQGFIGIPNWNFKSPTFDKIKEYDRRGRKLQAKAIESTGTLFKKWLVKKISEVSSQILKMTRI